MSDAQKSADDLTFHTDLSVGEILRRTRVHYGQSLEQIEQVLRIRAIQLEALETGDIEKLPGRVYAIGFVRAYAEYLGLDGDKMVQLFKQQSGGKQNRAALQFPVAADDTKVPTFPAVGVGIALCVAVAIGGYLLLGNKGGDESIPSVPDAMQEQTLSEAPSIIPSSEPPPQPPPMFNETGTDTVGLTTDPATGAVISEAAPAGTDEVTTAAIQRVVITIEDNSWVEIRNATGKVLLSQVLKPGDQFLVPNEPGMTLSTGNAGGLTVTLDGKVLPKVGEPAQVKRNISLNPSDLLKL